VPNNVTIGPMMFSLLVPEAERIMTERLLGKVRDSLVTKISSNLLILAIALFCISMFLLTRISKRFTKPITQLALASEEIGKGKYEELDLPPVENRQDEVGVLSHSFQKMVSSLRDREKIRGVLNKVVSKEIAATILNSNIEVDGELRILTMLFSDIRGFTPLSEIMEPRQLILLLNSYMTRMCRIIDETHGVVDKFVGDEIMALYGAPLALQHHAEKAVEAGLLMIEDLAKWNKERGENEPQIQVGMGIHTGSAFAGNMGAEDRQNYTIVGQNVNLAARLCAAAKPMQILVSVETYRAIANPEKFNFRMLEPIQLKGFDAPIHIYEVTRSF
jgi:adenylate cyclase